MLVPIRCPGLNRCLVDLRFFVVQVKHAKSFISLAIALVAASTLAPPASAAPKAPGSSSSRETCAWPWAVAVQNCNVFSPDSAGAYWALPIVGGPSASITGAYLKLPTISVAQKVTRASDAPAAAAAMGPYYPHVSTCPLATLVAKGVSACDG